MRPIKLELQNFGPFRSETIDFSDLHGKMFLLTGPTGSGKSMIFNGILYALYGSDSRVKTLRSQFAAEDEKSVVRLEFEMGNKVYIVERTMTIYREEKSDVPPKALLMFKDGKTIASGMKAVSEAILEVVHLNEHQFKQILLLPQGAFKEFLVSSSDEKSKILSTIFSAERFIYFEKSLERDVKEERARIEKLYLKLDHIFSQVKYERLESDALPESLDQIQGFEQQLEFIDKVNALIVEKIKETEREAGAVKEKKEQLQTDIKSRETHNVAVAQYEQLIAEKSRLDEQKIVIETLKTKIEQHKNALIMKHPLRSYDGNLKSMENSREKIAQLTEAIDGLQTKKNDVERELETLKKNAASVEEKERYIRTTERFLEMDVYQDIDKKLEEHVMLCNKLEEEIAKLTTEQSHLEEKKKQLTFGDDEEEILANKLEAVNNEIVETNKQIKHEHLDTKIKEIDAQITDTENERIELLNSMNGKYSAEDRSAIEHLTKHLEEGDNCPICSRVIEKLPEYAFYDAATNEQLNTIQRNLEVLKDQRKSIELEKQLLQKELKSDAELSLEELQAQLKEFEERQVSLSNSKKELKEKERAYYKNIESITELSNSLSLKKSDYNDKKNERDKLESTRSEFLKETKMESYAEFVEQHKSFVNHVDKHYAKRETLGKNLQTVNQNIAVSSDRLKYLQEQIVKEEEATRRLEGDLEAFLREQEIENIDVLRDILESDISEDETTVENYNNKLNEIKIKIASHIDAKTTERKVIQDDERDLLKELEVSHQTLVKHATLLKNDLHENNRLLEEIDTLGTTINEDIKTFERLNKVYEIIAGKGGHGISLHRFVLTYHLDRVLTHANIRLGDMTNGRYSLIRTNEANRKGSAAGLEIRVNDSFSGRSRHVDTLSGGETFQASLALALAINEIIIQSSGGIQLDTMLIDEGFGTLDQEALNHAIESLLGLEMSGKMVGIISHVEELKHRLEHKIEVIPNNDNSTTKLHV